MVKKVNSSSDAEPRTIATIADLSLRQGKIVIEVEGGERLAVPYRDLSYARARAIRAMVDDPVPPKDDLVDYFRPSGRRDETPKPVFNLDGQKFLAEQDAAKTKRVMLQLAAFIDIDWGTEDLEERVRLIEEHFGNAIVLGLIEGMRRVISESEARIEHRAGMFQQEGLTD